ncbi:MAG: type II toxin-antitoxin system HipA family toxin [Acholeplasmatales bacterium]|nr:type II toxin-antitoxin system HipA family toxin [Acholeplasmatales bacterium]
MKNKFLYVYFNDKLVGTLAENKDKKVLFQYDKNWQKNGFSINPFILPLTNEVFIPKKPYFDGLFGVFFDSLPDSWGRLLMDKYLKNNKLDYFTVLDKLSLISSFGMGALEYKPEYKFDITNVEIDLDEIAKKCKKLLVKDTINDLDQIFKLGGSSGGARPKILTKIENEDWIIKFNNHIDMKEIGLMEYEYSLCAKKVGIIMPETRLFESKKSKGYFGVKRFDRVNNRKMHMISVAALLEIDYRTPSLDYNDLMKLTKILTNNQEDLLQMYKRMCFNVFSHNQDDHAKNFSYIYDEKQKVYRLAPAYDLTYSNTFYNEHTTTINGNGKNITENDLIVVGKKAGLSVSLCKEIINEIRESVNKNLSKYIKESA